MSHSVDPCDKSVLTTGDVAKITGTAPRTVSKWFDSGALAGYNVPGSADRRIPRDNLIEFLKENGFPLGRLEKRVIFLTDDYKLRDCLAKRSSRLKHPPKADTETSTFEAGLTFHRFIPDCLVIDLNHISLSVAESVVGELKNLERIPYTIALLPDGILYEEVDKMRLFDQVFERPFDPELLSETVFSQVIVDDVL